MRKQTNFPVTSKPYNKILLLGVFVLCSVFFIGCDEEKAASVEKEAEMKQASTGFLEKVGLQKTTLTIPSGTNIPVRLLHSISSSSAQSGNDFEAELAAPITVDGRIAFPQGARVRGLIVTARPSGRLKDPGFLRLTLDAVQTDGGEWVDIETTSVSAKGSSHAKRNTTLIGGGAGVGAIIGAIAGGGKGAAIGAASGAGAGTAGALATGKKDVTFSAERKLSFSLTRAVAIKS